jgi:CheY-like chemotaxis protein
LRIEVRDNGVGISKMDQANVFREFFQLDQAHLDANKGLGLGLAIVDRLVKLLGHRIELRSAPGVGSVFALEVHRKPRSRRSNIQSFDRRHDADESLMAGKKVLVVDDDAAVLSGTSGLLKSWGCEPSMAASFSEVEQLLRDGSTWDFIISDYQLGGDKDGADVIALVRQHHNKLVPCILISGNTNQAVSIAANAVGYHLLHKPVKPGKLRSLIKHLLKEAA